MKIAKIIQASVASLGLVVGLSGLVGATGEINTTGPDSENTIKDESSVRFDVHNDNDVNVGNMNHQEARSGSAEVEDNTTGGNATSGEARNENWTEANVTVDNSAGMKNMDWGHGEMENGNGSGSVIKNTGPDSENKIETERSASVNVSNDNDVHVTNANCQTATSGNAEVSHNTTGGSATTGDAYNSNSSSFTVNVSN